MPATPPTGLDGDLLADDTFDAFAGETPVASAWERVRTRRGGPRAPLPMLPLIGLCAGIGLAYVAQTAHITQTSYQQTALASQQTELKRNAAALDDDLARLRSPERIDAAAVRLGFHPPARWAYVVAAPAPIAAPAGLPDPATTTAPAGPLQHIVEAMVGSFGDPGGGTATAGGDTADAARRPAQ